MDRRLGFQGKLSTTAMGILPHDNINDALNNLKDKDYAKYLDACSKLFTYVLPKKTDVTSDGERLIPKLPDITIG